jgi:hypothetical protein
LGTSTFSANAATIFDLVIGLAIYSTLREVLVPVVLAARNRVKAGHSTCPLRPAVNAFLCDRRE